VVAFGIGFWVLAGLLTYGQFLYNLSVSVSHQKELSKSIGKEYPGGNNFEGYLILGFLLAILMFAVIFGIPGLVWQFNLGIKLRNGRKIVENNCHKMFNRGWCI